MYKTMKKSIGLLALALAFAACNKNEIDLQPENEARGIPFSATVSAGKSIDTRALAESGTTLEATWAVGEKVALIHNCVSDEMTVSSVSEGLATITGTITGSPSNGDNVTIIYPSTAADGTTGNVKSDLLYRQDGTLSGTGGTSIAEKYDVRKGTATLTVGGTASLDGNVSLDNQFAIFKFTVRAADGTTAISARRLTVTIGGDTYTIAPKTATDVLYAALPAVSAQEVSFVATDVSGKTYSCAKASATFSARKYYQSTLKMNLKTETMNGHDYVDMGNGLKWATMNVGADSPEEYGDYFAWGATATQSIYNWANYPFMESGQSAWNHINKYTIADGQTDGIWYDVDGNFIGDNKKSFADDDYKDDAARKIWGSTWRMPTDAEWTWLRENCTWVWTDDYDGTRKAGMVVTSNVTGFESNSIFLPAAGYWHGTGLGYDGSLGGYWSSSLYEYGSNCAWEVYFFSKGVYRNPIDRFRGYSVRPVTSTPTNESIEHEYVDMGYGMKWATMNIGASGPSDYGDYFAWGETAPKLTYSLSTYFDPDYQIYHYQSGPTLGRPVRLKREDDAAHVLWGDDWRMPTFEEVTMLADKNKFTWTADHSAGEYVVTSKQTGKSLRFPYSGFMSDSENYGIGTWGGIWASSHMSSSSDLVSILYYADHDSRGGVLNSRYRLLGFPIRPIRVNKVNGHEYIDLGNGLGWALENLGVDDRHPTGRADTFAEGDPATAKWGAPWRTPTQAEWQWVLNTDNCYREKSADYETAGLWFINQESRSGRSLLTDRAIFLPNTNEGYFLYWTSSRDANGNLLYISVTDEYIKYIKSQDTKYQFVRPVFSLSELEE